MLHFLTTPPPDWAFGALPPGALLLAIALPFVACWVRGALRD